VAVVGRVTAPEVNPQPLPGARVTARLDSSFNDPLIRGVDKIGQAVQGIYKQEKAKADTAQVLEARRKLSDWERSWFDPNNKDGVYAAKGRDALGEPPDATQQKEHAFTSSVHATAVNGMLAAGKSDEAGSYLHDNIDDMQPEDAAKAQALLRPYLVDDTVQRYADGMTAGVVPADVGANLTLDQVWDAQTQQESGRHQFKDGKPLRSRAGAVGIAQIMPDTGPIAARYAGLPWDPVKFEMDAAYNEALGKAYMGVQMTAFGSAPLALAAYNAGPGRVQQWLKRNGDPRKGEVTVAEWVASIPIKETRDYVTRIAARSGAPVESATPAAAAAAAPAPVPAKPGAATADPVPVVPRTLTYAQQIEAAQQLPDKDVRRALVAELRSRHAGAEEQKNEADRATLERIHKTIESVPPGTRFQAAFGQDPDVVAYVAQNGLRENVDAWLLARAKREIPDSDPARVEYWKKERLYSPAKFAKSEVGILADPGLSSDDRSSLLASVAAMRDPKKRDAALGDYASDAQRVDDASRTLGWTSLKPTERAHREGVFSQAVRQAEKAFIQTQKREPKPEEKDVLVRNVTRNFAEDKLKAEGRTFADQEKRVTQYETDNMRLDPATRSRVAAALTRRLGRAPSEAEILADVLAASRQH
jgi:hypothetical protein